jgi:hypothetical protein
MIFKSRTARQGFDTSKRHKSTSVPLSVLSLSIDVMNTWIRAGLHLTYLKRVTCELEIVAAYERRPIVALARVATILCLLRSRKLLQNVVSPKGRARIERKRTRLDQYIV